MSDPAFDCFHPPSDDDPYWTETFWLSFWIPERILSGTVYTWFRPNLGVAASCVALWDDTASSPWDVPFYEYQWHLPFPTEQDLRDLALPNGLTLRCDRPEHDYTVSYRHDELELDLRFEAITEPHEVPMARLRFVGSAHFDQPGRVTGRVVVDGEEIGIDCLAMRDRSWGPRPDRGGQRAGYTSATASSLSAFHTISVAQGDAEPIVAGYLVRDGRLADVVSGTRRVAERRAGIPSRVIVEGVDAEGREFAAEGTCANRLAFPTRPNNLTWMSLTRWSFDGAIAWGEDQDIWTPETWRASRRG